MKELRFYQREACDAVYSHIHDGGRAPLIELATGLGKSLCIATLCQELIDAYPQTRILMATHRKELIKQNFQELISLWPQAPVGINSAGLKRRNWSAQILFAGIQSIYKHLDNLGAFECVVIDEAHLIGRAATGMYQNLISALREHRPKMGLIGLTATPFRMDSGPLAGTEGALFDKIVYSYGVAQGIRDGYLSPLISPAMSSQIDVSRVKKRGGEFIKEQLQAAAIANDNVEKAADEILAYGGDRRAWLVFCTGIQHAEMTHEALVRRGVNVGLVHQDVKDRDAVLRAFARGELQAIVNVDILTTGFNVPHTDLVAILRPCQSPGLVVQMIGRGSRLAEGKENCLVLDFGGNLKRHGPLDTMTAKEPARKGEKAKEPLRVKICPECNGIMRLEATTCPQCGEEYPKEERAPKHDGQADAESVVLSTQSKPVWVNVTSWRFHLGRKALGKPKYLRIEYLYGLANSVNDFLCFEHGGYALEKAKRRWAELQKDKKFWIPQTSDEAYTRLTSPFSETELVMPSRIQIARDGKYFKVVRLEFAGAEHEKAA